MNTDQQLHDIENQSTSLDGTWTFRLDPDGVGVDEEWSTRQPWADEECHEVAVPHAWEEVDAFRDYTGVAWYRRTVSVDEVPTESDALLHFGAVDYEATVWVNGDRCGSHRGGYLPFDVDVTDALEPGENVVTIRVEDPENIDEIPHGKQGEPWYTRVSGIWQSVSLDIRPSTRVTDVRVTPDLDDDSVEIDLEAIGPVLEQSSLSAEVTICRDGEQIAETAVLVDGTSTESTATASVTISLDDPDYWHPDDPVLYDIVVELTNGSTAVHTFTDYFGMRSVSFEGRELYLNGEPLFVRGALDQGYYPKTLYRPFEDDLFEREIRTAKDLGFNMLRKHIKPAHPDFLEAADRLGILVWEEVANPARYSERSKREVREQVQGLIDRDYNRPSVIIWSLYNEEWGLGHHQDESYVWDDPEKQETLGHLYEEATEWDPTRLVCDNSGWAHVATDVNDYHRYFASPDRSDAWADDLDEIAAHPEDNYAAEWTDPQETPIIVSEFGTWGLCDVDRLRETYDGTPPWFYHSFLVPEEHRGEDLDSHHLHLETGVRRSPAGFEDRYNETAFPEMIGDLDSAVETWQWRQFYSIKDQIEEMRTRDDLAGYVITEWTDIEWEFNGILDYLREQKVFHDEFAGVNSALAAVVEPESHVTWADEPLPIDVSVVNDGGVGGPMTVSWTIRDDGETIRSGSREIDGPTFGTTAVEQLSVAFDAPSEPRQLTVEVTIEGEAGTVTNSEPIVVIPPNEPARHDLSVFVQDDVLAERLNGARYTVVDTVDDADVAVVSDVGDHVGEFVDHGATALLLPGTDSFTPETNLFSYRELPPGENWNLASAMYAQASPLLADVTSDNRLGWAFEGIYPNSVATDLHREADDVHVGYIEGWMANWGSPLVVRPVGKGHVCSCTFPIGEHYGEHPVATLLFDRLVDALAETERGDSDDTETA